MTGARTAVALYVAIALHAVALLFLLLAPVPQTGAGGGVGLTLAGAGSVLAAPGTPSVRSPAETVAPTPTPIESASVRIPPATTTRTVKPPATPATIARASSRDALTPPDAGPSRSNARPAGESAAGDFVAHGPNVANGVASAGYQGGGGTDGYFARLRTHLATYRRTVADPAAGRAEVRFTVLADGRAADVELAVSSGSSNLDAEALALVMRAQPMPLPPRGEPLRVQVPVYVGS